MNRIKTATSSLIITLGLIISYGATTPNASIKGKEGICKNSPVLTIKPTNGNGQVEAKAFKTDDTIEKQLNRKLNFLEENPNHQDKGTVELIINCRGKLVECSMSNKTKNEELDAQILAVFRQLKTWTAATIRARPVNSKLSYDFTIEKGEISL